MFSTIGGIVAINYGFEGNRLGHSSVFSFESDPCASLGSKLGCAAGVLCMLAASSAKANIVFCNEFPAEVWVAIAYQQEDGSWLSRGWLSAVTFPAEGGTHVEWQD